MRVNKNIKVIIYIFIALFLLFVFLYINLDRIKGKIPYGSKTFQLGLSVVYKFRDLADLVYLSKMQGESVLPVYEINIDKDNLVKMNEGLSKVGEDRVFNDELKESVPAKFIFEDKEYDVEISYRGLQDIHWNADKKSYSIKFDKDKKFAGARKLNLILPIDRKYFIEALNSYRADKFGLMAAPIKFVNLKLNGKLQGVYIQQEGWSDEFLEHIGKSRKGKLFKTRDIRANICKTKEQYYECLKKYVSLWELVAGQDEGLRTYEEFKKLFNVFSIEDNNLFAQEIVNVADVEKFLKWNAHYLLVQSYHQGISNLRLYFDPNTKKFEPVVWDVNMDMNHNHPSIPSKIDEIDIKYNPFVDRLLAVPEFRHRRNEILWDYIQDNQELEDDLAFYDKLYMETKLDFYRDRLKRKSNFSFDADTELFSNNLINYYKNLQTIFESSGYIVDIESRNGMFGINILVDSFVSTNLDKVTVDLQDSDNDIFSVYQDTNNNKQLDGADKLLATERSKNDILELKSLDGVMYRLYDLESGVLSQPKSNYFFVIFDKSIEYKSIEIEVLNTHTNKKSNNFSI